MCYFVFAASHRDEAREGAWMRRVTTCGLLVLFADKIDINPHVVNCYPLATSLAVADPMHNFRSIPMSNFSPVLRTVGASVLAAGGVLALSGCGVLMSVIGGGNVMDLNVGDCFVEEEMNTALSSGEVSNIPLVDCAEEHDSEFFFAYDMTEAEYPGDEATRTQAEELCTGEEFTDFVGVEYLESDIYVGHLYPTQQSWDQFDDREIICYVTTSSTDEMVTGTLQGSNR
jgi:hypothetical protein